MKNLITITLDSPTLTQEQAIVRGCQLILDQTWPDLGKPILEIIEDDIAVVVEVR